MTQMIRKQIYIQKRQQVLLKRLAKVRGVSEAEIIRQAIDRQTGSSAARREYPDPAAFERAFRFMLSRRTLGTESKQVYKWKREDAYGERLSRHARKLE